jgi:hypothetical protein
MDLRRHVGHAWALLRALSEPPFERPRSGPVVRSVALAYIHRRTAEVQRLNGRPFSLGELLVASGAVE